MAGFLRNFIEDFLRDESLEKLEALPLSAGKHSEA